MPDVSSPPATATTPNRPPDWRWERARWLLESGRRRLAGEDECVRLLRGYQAARGRVRTAGDLDRLAATYPGVYCAELVREDPNRAIRWGLEARLLSRQPLPDVASRTGLTVDAVRWYEAAFYNVLDKLDAPDYIASVVVGEAMHRSLHPRDYHLLWKLYGYAGGPDVLDAVIAQNLGGGAVRDWLDADAARMLSLKANQAVRTMPIAFNHAVVLDAYLRLQQATAQAAALGGGAASNDLVANIGSMLKSVGDIMTVGRNPDDVDRYVAYDRLAVEPRAADLLALAAGSNVATVPDVVFPAPEPVNLAGGK